MNSAIIAPYCRPTGARPGVGLNGLLCSLIC
jgi:hypothetical protein